MHLKVLNQQTTARIVANATAEMKPMNKSPPKASLKCTAAMVVTTNKFKLA